jgi:cytochrome c oxidase cbb3-type subunit 2
MPKYGFLLDRAIKPTHVAELMETHRAVGVPYSDEMIANAAADFAAQADPDADTTGLQKRYGAEVFGKDVPVSDFDRRPGISEMEALIAYMQMLGTMVDFSTFEPDASR